MSLVVAAQGGLFGGNGAVNINHADMVNRVSLTNKNIEAVDMNLLATLQGNLDVIAAYGKGGKANLGAIVAKGDQHSSNKVIVDPKDKSIRVSGNFTAQAGDLKSAANSDTEKKYSYSDVSVQVYSLSGGAITGNAVVALAYNNPIN